MKIALIQQHATTDKSSNVARGLAGLEAAARAGAELACYAELAFEWFHPQHPASGEVRDLAEPLDGPTVTAFQRKARELGIVTLINLFEREGADTYDSSPVIDADGSLLGVTRMIHITEYPCFHEQGYYTPGDKGAPVYDTRAGKIGIAICYDRHFPEYMRALALAGADLVIVPQAGVAGEWPAGLYEGEMQVAAFQNGYFVALCNRVGQEDCLNFAGESFVCGPDGSVLARAQQGTDEILYAEIDPAANARSRRLVGTEAVSLQRGLPERAMGLDLVAQIGVVPRAAEAVQQSAKDVHDTGPFKPSAARAGSRPPCGRTRSVRRRAAGGRRR